MRDFLLKVCRRSGARLPLLGAVALVFLLGSSSAIEAAPVTFAFEAEISSVSLGIPFDSGVDFEEGDVISGQFTFEPNAGDGNSPFTIIQPHAFSVNINGIGLATTSYMATSFNDTQVADVPGSTGTVDTLELAGEGLSPTTGTILPNIATELSRFRMSLWENVALFNFGLDILETASVPASVDIWNRLQFRRTLSVSLRDGQGGAVGFQATVRLFSVVPEPSSFVLMLLVFAIILTRSRSHDFKLDL